MMMNVFTSGGDRTFSDHLGSTVKTVFPSLFVLELEGNLLFLSPRDAESLKGLKTRLAGQTHSKLAVVVRYALGHLTEFRPQEKVLIFTDDWAPTGKLIYDMIKNQHLKSS